MNATNDFFDNLHATFTSLPTDRLSGEAIAIGCAVRLSVGLSVSTPSFEPTDL